MFRSLKIWWRKARRAPLNPLAAWLGQGLMWLLYRTCQIEVNGVENLHQSKEKGPCILMLWHNRMIMVPYSLWHYAADYIYTCVISNSRDGDLLAAMANVYKQGRSLRVPHNARHKALRAMIQRVQKGEILMLTPDGPRGPRYKVKPGITFTAKASGAYVIPFSWSASKFWQLKSWDGLIFPKPFSKIIVEFGTPICSQELEDKGAGSKFLEERLIQLTEQVCSKLNSWPS